MARRVLLGTIVAVLTLCAAAPASAELVTRLPPGDRFTSVAVAPNGAVWATRAEPGSRVGIGHLTPTGFAWTSVRARGLPEASTVMARPDGGAWALVEGGTAYRLDPDGRVTRVSVVPGAGSILGTGAVAPDGALWVAAGISPVFRLGLDGSRTVRRFTVPAAVRGESCLTADLAAPADGSLWLGIWMCRGIVRVAPDGTVRWTRSPGEAPGSVEALAVGPDGTAWAKGGGLSPRLFRVTPAGQVVDLGERETAGYDLAVAPDGSAWLNDPESCSMLHLTGTTVTASRTPVAAPTASAVGPDGTLWLTSTSTLLHVTPAELQATWACDTEDPRIASPTGRRPVSLRALRRDGLRLRSTEPATMSGSIDLDGTERELVRTEGTIDRRGTVIRFPRASLRLLARRLAQGRRTRLQSQVELTDESGNAITDLALRITVVR